VPGFLPMTGEQARLVEAAARELGTPLDPDSLRRLDTYLGLVELWNQRSRLVGDRDPSVILAKHLVDSLAPAALLPAHGLVVDVGSGGGFPGAVMGCLRPDLQLVLVESRRRPVSFLREVVRSVPLPAARVVEARGEDAAAEPALRHAAEVVVSRALRPDMFLPIAAELVRSTGIVIAMQTPASSATTIEAGNACGLEAVDQCRYALPSGEARMLIVFRQNKVP
jgi:16S rRNA (guanine527-N7)-methyltransferase